LLPVLLALGTMGALYLFLFKPMIQDVYGINSYVSYAGVAVLITVTVAAYAAIFQPIVNIIYGN